MGYVTNADIEGRLGTTAYVQLTDDAPIGRDELMQRLLDQDISTRRGIMLSHVEPDLR